MTGGDVQPRFVYAEGLYHICKALIYAVDLAAVQLVLIHMRFHQHEIRTFLFCLPDGLGSDYAIFFSKLVFGQYDTVAVVRISAYGHGPSGQFGMSQKFYRSVKAVHVTVKNYPVIFANIHFYSKPSCPIRSIT